MKSLYLSAALLGMLVVGCSGSSADNGSAGGSFASGGTQATGGAANTGGAMPSGGAKTTTGGASSPTGGKSATGGSNTGGLSSGGASRGGAGGSGGIAATGGAATGGAATGGQATGGKAASGGSNTGGQATGGSGATTGGSGAATGGGGGTAKSSGCGKTPTIPSSQYNNGTTIPITAGGMQRRYVLNVPSNYDNNHPYRLVVAYHQRDGNDKQLHSLQYYGLLPLSNSSTIFVAPNGQKNGAPCSGTGNGDSNCGWPNTGDSDLALADAIVATLKDNFCIDTDRIFATGWSYGGSMSYRTACSRPQGGTASWGVRAIAVYSAAQLSGSCTPSKPVAYFAEHGTRDSVLNYDSMGIPLARSFATANGCTWATPTKVTSGAHVCTQMSGCMTGYPVEFCSFNGDHTPFPDNGQSAGSWGPQEAWKFLSQF